MSRWQIYEVVKDADGVDCYIKRGEIVRCKECKHWSEKACHKFLATHPSSADDFCSYGEREGK